MLFVARTTIIGCWRQVPEMEMKVKFEQLKQLYKRQECMATHSSTIDNSPLEDLGVIKKSHMGHSKLQNK